MDYPIGMAFEPLETDEKLDVAPKKAADMDTLMLIGCTGFVIASLGIYALSVWPFFAFPAVGETRTLAICVAAGLLPSALLAFVCGRKFALAGACGAIGGALATGMFLYLRIHQAFLAYLARQSPPPGYPQLLEAVVPLAWILAVALVALMAMPNERGESSADPKP